MAGEARGKALEAIVVAAILHSKRIEWSDIAWDAPVQGLRWKPDIYLDSQYFPNGLFAWITFAGSENDSQQKAWRSLAELIDVRTSMGTEVRCVSILAGGRIRDKFRRLHQFVFSDFIELEALFSDDSLNNLLNHVGRGKATHRERVDRVIELMPSDPSIKRSLSLLASELFEPKHEPTIESEFWATRNTHFRTSEVKETFFRRGMAKAALLAPADLRAVIEGQRVDARAHHEALLTSGILSRSISGIRIKDPEVNFAIAHVPGLGEIIEENISVVGRSSRERIADIGLMQDALQWLEHNWQSTRQCNVLAAHLEQSPDGAPNPQSIFAAVKAVLALRQGRQGQQWLEEVEDLTGTVKSVLIGLVIPKFERAESKLPAKVRVAIAQALASRLAQVEKLSSDEIPKVVEGLIRKEVETRMVCHGLDGVGSLIGRRLSENNIPFARARLTSGLSERLGFSNRDFSLSNGIMTESGVFIHWRTVTRQGRDHKVKELGARVYQARRSWSQGEWKLRQTPHRTCLIVDGDWDTQGLNFLAQSGWDVIVRPDELEMLLEVIQMPRAT